MTHPSPEAPKDPRTLKRARPEEGDGEEFSRKKTKPDSTYVVTLYNDKERSDVTIPVPKALDSTFKLTVRGWEASPSAGDPEYPYLLSTRDEDAIWEVCELLGVQDAVNFDKVHALTTKVPIMYPRDGPVFCTTEVAWSSPSTTTDAELYQKWVLDIDKQLRVAEKSTGDGFVGLAVDLRVRRAEVIKWWAAKLD